MNTIKQRIFYLDFIRAIATILIIVWHFNSSLRENYISQNGILHPYNANGYMGEIGVSLFFIISGVVLMKTYEEKLDIKEYLKRRFIAIYPMFWIAYSSALLYFFYINKSINHDIPKSRILLSFLGLDGYLLPIIPNFYILGEWFLGCIIIFYLCFPILRILLIKWPKLLLGSIFIYYIIVVSTYNSTIPIDWNILTRIFDIVLGMYFFKYIKKVHNYQFVIALIVSAIMLYVPININHMYEITITGSALFIVLSYLGQQITQNKVKSLFTLISKYSYAVFLTHHVVINQIQRRFVGIESTKTEMYFLLLISIIVIAIMSNVLYRINKNVISYIKK
ncbi:acyltransferase [Clostridium sp. CTA-5]